MRRIGRGIAFATAVAVVALGVPASVSAAKPDGHGSHTGGVPGAPASDLQAAVTQLHGLGITGVQALARDGHRDTYVRAGNRDLRTGAPVPRDGYFRMGSNTKTFAAVVVLQLVGEGRLTLDDTIEQWLPGLVRGNGNDGSGITVRQVLQHTSGLYNYTFGVPALTSAEGFAAHRFDHYEPEELVAIAVTHPPEFAPGTSWNYSNTNYILAGMLIERVTGKSWADEVQRRILGPLRLNETYSPGDRAELPRPHARGYQQFVPDGPLIDATEFNTTMAYAAGDLVTTPSDLVRFWQALQQGRLLAPAQLAEMQRTVLAETFQEYLPGARYGLGVMWRPNECGGYWSHDGDVPGTSNVNGTTTDGSRVVVLALSTQFAAEEPALAVIRRSEQLVTDTLCAGR